jgi:hypothetical protein
MPPASPLPSIAEEAIVESSGSPPPFIDIAPFAFFVFMSAPVLNSLIFVRLKSQTHRHSSFWKTWNCYATGRTYVSGAALLASGRLALSDGLPKNNQEIF